MSPGTLQYAVLVVSDNEFVDQLWQSPGDAVRAQPQLSSDRWRGMSAGLGATALIVTISSGCDDLPPGFRPAYQPG